MSFTSEIRSREIVVDDPEKHSDPTRGENGGYGYEPRNYSANPFGTLPYAKAFDFPIIPRSEWTARIEEKERTKTRLSDLRRVHQLRSSDQGNTNYCWMHGMCNALRLVRAAMGLPYLDLSPASAAAPLKSFRNNGGWSGEAAEWLSENGVNTLEEWPANSRDRKYYTEENRAKARERRVTEFTELEGNRFDQLATCCLLDFPAGFGIPWGRGGHLICAMDLVVISAGKFGIRAWNSWSDDYGEDGEFILTEARATPWDAVAVRSATPVEA